MPTDVFAKVTPAEQRGIVLFLTHALRLMIIMQSIDRRTLENNDILQRVLRRFVQFEMVFPENKKLMEVLKGDVIWFKHDSSKCKLSSFYKSQEKFV
jgi:hypothetical protein